MSDVNSQFSVRMEKLHLSVPPDKIDVGGPIRAAVVCNTRAFHYKVNDVSDITLRWVTFKPLSLAAEEVLDRIFRKKCEKEGTVYTQDAFDLWIDRAAFSQSYLHLSIRRDDVKVAGSRGRIVLTWTSKDQGSDSKVIALDFLKKAMQFFESDLEEAVLSDITKPEENPEDNDDDDIPIDPAFIDVTRRVILRRTHQEACVTLGVVVLENYEPYKSFYISADKSALRSMFQAALFHLEPEM